MAQATVDVEAAELLVTKSVCAGDDINQGDGDATTPLDPCPQYVVTGDATPDVVTYYLHFENPSGVRDHQYPGDGLGGHRGADHVAVH